MEDDKSSVGAMNEFEDDLVLAEATDLLERQLAYREQIGGGATPLLNFQLHPVNALVNWRNALNKQWFEARLQQHRDASPHDDLGLEVTDALRRTITRQLETDTSLTPHSNCIS